MYDELTAMVLDYQKGLVSENEVIEKVSVVVYNFPRKNLYWSEDERSDFFLFFYPKLITSLKRFKCDGKSFLNYLMTCIRWQIQSFRREAARKNEISQLSEEVVYHEQLGAEETEEKMIVHSPPVSGTFDDHGRNRRGAFEKRILYLVLKAGKDVNDQMIDKVARATQIEEAQIHRWVEEARLKLSLRSERIKRLQERRSQFFMKWRYYKEQTQKENWDKIRKENWSLMAHRKKEQLVKLNRLLIKRPVTLTNADVAQILGVSKGTVDSGLYHLKKRLKDLFQS